MKTSCGIGGFETANAILMRCPTCHYKLRDSINNRNKWRHSRTHTEIEIETETEAQPNVAVKRPHDILFLARQVWYFISLSLSFCVWPCGRLISINVETNLKCENRKPKTENRIRMGAQQIKIKIKVCRGVSRTGNCELGTFLTHIIWWFYDFTTHIVALYDISSGRLTTFLVGTVGIG